MDEEIVKNIPANKIKKDIGKTPKVIEKPEKESLPQIDGPTDRSSDELLDTSDEENISKSERKNKKKMKRRKLINLSKTIIEIDEQIISQQTHEKGKEEVSMKIDVIPPTNSFRGKKFIK
ncbi:hypothetical protein JTB14_012108 [Gonioctena quinquepunctata]|nr:hypothetical protein JTB14_012108 [Gonioctena quinquepunctata]